MKPFFNHFLHATIRLYVRDQRATLSFFADHTLSFTTVDTPPLVLYIGISPRYLGVVCHEAFRASISISRRCPRHRIPLSRIDADIHLMQPTDGCDTLEIILRNSIANIAVGSCPADPALGTSASIDFTHGPSDFFKAAGNPTYDSNGAAFTIAKSGDSPQLMSNKYIMFGRVEFVIKAAPGVGIVSSAVLQSDALDEIDWEWLGADNAQVQSNYFGKGMTTTYNRGAFHPDPNNQNGFHTYTIDWTADQIVWQIDGTTVRALTQASAAAGQYPQTPMMIKVGAWSGGDASNAPGTIRKSRNILST